MLLELERVWNHLNDIAAICAGTGLAPGNQHFAGLTERARRLNHRLTGHRFGFGTVHIGGSSLDLGPDDTRSAREELAGVREHAELGWRSLLDNLSFQDRLAEVGTLTATDAYKLGTVGPALRATGVHDDARTHSTGLTYDGFEPVVPEVAGGDVRARLEQRMLEFRQSIQLLDTLLDRPIRPSAALNGGRERSLGVGRVESPAGETSCIIERDHDRSPAATPAHRLLRQLADGRRGRRRKPPAGLPPHQQELRALLRLRRPLMLALFRDLRHLRHGIGLARPDRPRSLAIRHVDAGSCNGCEHELTLTASPYYDLDRYGLGIVASPRHADILLITGAITTRMLEPLLAAYHAMPEPRRVAALGNCALGCNLLGTQENHAGPLETILSIDLRISRLSPGPGRDRRCAARTHRPPGDFGAIGPPRSSRLTQYPCGSATGVEAVRWA